MKIYHLNILYQQLSFDIRLCSNSYKDAASRIGVTTTHLQTYGSSIKCDGGFTEILAKAYCHKAKLIIGCGELEFEYVKYLIDEHLKKINK